jgi:hypothetical protein
MTKKANLHNRGATTKSRDVLIIYVTHNTNLKLKDTYSERNDLRQPQLPWLAALIVTYSLEITISIHRLVTHAPTIHRDPLYCVYCPVPL